MTLPRSPSHSQSRKTIRQEDDAGSLDLPTHCSHARSPPYTQVLFEGCHRPKNELTPPTPQLPVRLIGKERHASLPALPHPSTPVPGRANRVARPSKDLPNIGVAVTVERSVRTQAVRAPNTFNVARLPIAPSRQLASSNTRLAEALVYKISYAVLAGSH